MHTHEEDKLGKSRGWVGNAKEKWDLTIEIELFLTHGPQTNLAHAGNLFFLSENFQSPYVISVRWDYMMLEMLLKKNASNVALDFLKSASQVKSLHSI